MMKAFAITIIMEMIGLYFLLTSQKNPKSTIGHVLSETVVNSSCDQITYDANSMHCNYSLQGLLFSLNNRKKTDVKHP